PRGRRRRARDAAGAGAGFRDADSGRRQAEGQLPRRNQRAQVRSDESLGSGLSSARRGSWAIAKRQATIDRDSDHRPGPSEAAGSPDAGRRTPSESGRARGWTLGQDGVAGGAIGAAPADARAILGSSTSSGRRGRDGRRQYTSSAPPRWIG